MILDNIKKDMMDAKLRKDVLRANLLSALYSEIYTLSKSGKETGDEDSLKVIKKFIKNTDETLGMDLSDEQKKKYSKEKEILTSYLPKQLTPEETDGIVKELLSEGKQIKDIMNHFKEKYPGQFDGKLVNEKIRMLQTS